jgi:hypothetical protein
MEHHKLEKLKLDVIETKNNMKFLCMSVQKIEQKVDRLFLYLLTGLGTSVIIFLTALLKTIK